MDDYQGRGIWRENCAIQVNWITTSSDQPSKEGSWRKNTCRWRNTYPWELGKMNLDKQMNKNPLTTRHKKH